MDNTQQRQHLEASIANAYPDAHKDILIVVKDGFEYVRDCLESIRKNTGNYTIYVWDNGSGKKTKNYLAKQKDVVLTRSETNLGFIVPNNRMMEKASSPYFILLNSDTKVGPMWDRSMLGVLQVMPKIGAVGYGGGLLNEGCVGVGSRAGIDVDFVQGFCLAGRRDTYEKHGLFDEDNLSFAYGEDSDYCLRLKEAGMMCYALALPLVWHRGGATTETLVDDVLPHFNANHNYLRKRWKNYLEKDRMLLKAS